MLRSPDVGEEVVSTLAKMPTPPVVEALLVALNDQNTHIREYVAFALAEIGNSQAVEYLLPILQEEKLETWEEEQRLIKAIKALANFWQEQRVVEALLVQLQGDWRVEAAQALGHIGDAQIGDLLLQALRNSKHEDDRGNWLYWPLTVAEALVRIGNIEGTEEVLMPLIEKWYPTGDEEGDYERAEIVRRILEAMNDSCWIKILEKMLRNWGKYKKYDRYNEDIIMKEVENTLVSVGASAIECLLVVLQDKQEDVSVRASAVRVLGNIRDTKTIDVLVESLLTALQDKRENMDVRESAARVLGDIRDTRSTDGLIEVLQEGEAWWLHKTVAQILGQIGDTRSVPPLLNTLQRALNDLHDLFMWEYDNYRYDDYDLEDKCMDENEFFRLSSRCNREELEHSKYLDENDWEKDALGKYYFLEYSIVALEKLAQDYHDLPTLYDHLLDILSNKVLEDKTREFIYERLLLRLCSRLRRAVGKDWLDRRRRILEVLGTVNVYMSK